MPTWAVSLQPDAKIVLGGNVSLYPAPNCFPMAVVRFEPDGRLDSTFGVGGASSKLNEAPWNENLTLMRFRSDGTLDPTFGVDGVARENVRLASDRAGGAPP